MAGNEDRYCNFFVRMFSMRSDVKSFFKSGRLIFLLSCILLLVIFLNQGSLNSNNDFVEDDYFLETSDLSLVLEDSDKKEFETESNFKLLEVGSLENVEKEIREEEVEVKIKVEKSHSKEKLETKQDKITTENPVMVKVPKTGIYAYSVEEVKTVENRLGADFDYVVTYVHWANNPFPRELADYLAEQNKTLVIFWNPMDYSVKEQGGTFSFVSVTSGTWDKYIEEFVFEATKTKGNIMIIPCEEVNGNWTPWSVTVGNYGNLSEYQTAFQYLAKKLKQAKNVQVGFVVNSTSQPPTFANRISAYYPGDEFIDFIGVNGFNFGGPSLGFEDIFSAALDEVSKFKKPVFITSMATFASFNKKDWVKDFLNSEIIKDGKVEGWFWFNENKERDWRIWSDKETENIFKEYLGSLEN